MKRGGWKPIHAGILLQPDFNQKMTKDGSP